jgi:hypothetical protein
VRQQHLRGALDRPPLKATELASIADPAKVFAAVAQTLGVDLPAGRPPQQGLAELLAGQQLLLVLADVRVSPPSKRTRGICSRRYYRRGNFRATCRRDVHAQLQRITNPRRWERSHWERPQLGGVTTIETSAPCVPS